MSAPSDTLPGLGALSGRDFLSSADLTAEETLAVLDVARQLKQLGLKAPAPFQRQCVAIYFEKPSLRTRVTFETGVVQLGGHPIYLTPADAGLGVRETVEDFGRNVSRWLHGVVARVFSHNMIERMAQAASIPIINALSDDEHPCQALADFQTIIERAGSARDFPLAWIGDGNNVCHSVLLTGARLGSHIRVASPPGYEPDRQVLERARRDAAATGATIQVMAQPEAAVEGARAVYTDVWTSMGQEAEREERMRRFAGYQVNETLMARAAPDAFLLHCLPAHRGEEVSAGVMDGPHSAVFDQAENRLWSQKAILAMTMG